MIVTWLGQAGLLFETKGAVILVDPYLSDACGKVNPASHRRVPVEERFLKLAPDVIVLTHAHADHTDPETLAHFLSETSRVTVLASEDAWEAGADIVKLFPADDLGYHYIWNLKGPLPHIPLLASGGVNPDTIPKFLGQGYAAVGTGVSIIDRELLAKDDYDGIAALARRHVDAVAEFCKEA